MALQLSLGPVFFAVLHKALTEGSREALKMTFGAAIIDALYIGLSFTGIALILQFQIMQNAILVTGAIILVLFGLRHFRRAHSRKVNYQGAIKGSINVRPDDVISKKIHGSSFAYGLKLTAINPLTIVFWSGTFGALIASGTLSSTGEALMYASGCVSSTIFFLGLISITAQYFSLRFDKKLEFVFDLIVGAILIAYGLFMVYRFINIIIK